MKKWLLFRVLIWSLVILVLCLLPTKDLSKVDAFKIPHLDKIAHFGLFFLFAVFFYGWLLVAFAEHKKWNVLWTLLLVASYGFVIEWLQENYFSRSGDFLDWVADMIGGGFGVLLYPILHKTKLFFLKLYHS